MRRLKLANVILDSDNFLSAAQGLFYRAPSAESCRFSHSKNALILKGKVDFCTYFNMLPVGAWKKYCSIRSGRLRLVVSGGSFSVTLKAFRMKGEHAVADDVKTVRFDASDVPVNREMDVPFGDHTAIGFEIESADGVCIQDADYYVLVDEQRLHPVNLNVCLANRPSDRSVVPNLRSFFKSISITGESIADRVHFTVIDNENDLRKAMDAMEDLPQIMDLSLVEARDRGRAGSMAAAMRSSANASSGYTHMVFIDSDTRVHPESLRRMYTMLTLLAPEYALSTIAGAYFRLDKPYRQLGDVRRCGWFGGTTFVKKPVSANRPYGLVVSSNVDVELSGTYAPWNFVCMPVSLFREHGLPMPFYVRCEDMEFGMRAHPLCIAMMGLASWDFDAFSRHGDEVSCYQYPRNMLVANAVTHCFNETAFMFQYWRRFRILLRYLNYEAAELWLDALEDYMKGPGYLSKLDGAQKLTDNKAQVEQLHPLTDLAIGSVNVSKVQRSWLESKESPNSVRRVFETVPHDSHYLPEFLLIKRPGIVGTQGNAVPWVKTCFRRQLLVLGEDGEMGGIRSMDKARFKALNRRAANLKLEFRNTKLSVALRYQDEFRALTSCDQWN